MAIPSDTDRHEILEDMKHDSKQSRKFLAIGLCVILVMYYKRFVWDAYFEQRQVYTTAQNSSSMGASNSSTAGAQIGSASSQGSSGQSTETPAVAAAPSDSDVKGRGLIQVDTEMSEVQISLLGGRVTELHLKNFAETSAKESPRLNLVQHLDGKPYPLGVRIGDRDDSAVMYEVVGTPTKSISLTENATETLILRGAFPDGQVVTKTFEFVGNSYLFGFQAIAENSEAPLEVEWSWSFSKDSPTLLDPYRISGYSWFDGSKSTHKPFGDAFPDALTNTVDLGKVKWASMADKYFLVSLVADSVIPAKAVRSDGLYSLRFQLPTSASHLKVLVGPKSYNLLKSSGDDLQRNIDFGLTGFIAAPLLLLLHRFFAIFGNYGVAIVLLTILVKSCVWPLTRVQFKSASAMKKLEPEIRRIRETVTDAKQQQLEIMATYKKNGVNPFGGCFPALIQMPIFIGLYSALMLSIELRHAHYGLWITDLSAPEKLMLGGIGIPIMVILFVASMIVQQWTMPSNLDPTQKKVMMVMPVVMGFMFMNFPAGLTLYWLTNNFISIGQQKAFEKDKGRHVFLMNFGVSAVVFLLAWGVTKL